VNPSTPTRRRSTDASLVLAGNALALGLAFLAGLLAARVFEPALRGEYAMLTSVCAFVSVLSGLGFAEAIVYFYRRGEADPQRTATSIVFVNAGIALLVLGAAVALGPWLATRYFPTGGVAAAWVAVGAGLLGIVQRNGNALFQARGLFLRSSGVLILQPAVFVAALAAIGATGASFAVAVAMFGISFVLPALVVLVPLLPQVSPRALDVAYLGRVARFSAKSYVNVALSQLNYRLDLFIVGALIPDLARLADYHIASTLAGLIWILPDAYATAIYPRLAGLASERERSAEALMALRVVLVPVVVLAIGLAVAAPLFVPLLFGERYAGAVPLTLLLLPGTVAMSLNKVLSRYFLGSNRQQVAAFGMAAGVIIDVVALVVLIPRWGVTAAPIAASAAYFASLAVSGSTFLIGAELRREDFRGFPGREIRAYLRVARAAWQRLRVGRNLPRAGG
jgi:O-antigen/teichoic acid export membrane protein